MNDTITKALLEKYLAGDCTPEEKIRIERAYNLSIPEHVPDISETRYAEMSDQVWAHFDQQHRLKHTVRIWYRLTGVAAAIALIVLGAYFFKFPYAGNKAAITYTNDINPGKKGATLTLANGERIRLSSSANGEIANEAGVRISKTADGQLIYELKQTAGKTDKTNTLSTTRGETYQVLLPDGSLVALNSASSLTYHTGLNDHGKRIVKLAGEAYFEVAKDKMHPFVVKTAIQEVEVLGTHFNIDSYGDERLVKTTLLEGSVKVSSSIARDNTGETILKPGQQASLSGSSGQIKVVAVDVQEEIAWKNNMFIFNDESLGSIMQKIARWYDIEVEYQDSELMNLTFWGRISRFEKVSKVLHLLERAGNKNVHFHIAGKRIKVTAE